MLAWRDENGDIPENALANAIEERDAYLAQFGDSDGFGEMPISNLPWLSRGPTNVGGRTRGFVVHPTDPNIIYAASTTGGVWKSNNQGNSWLPVNNRLTNLSIGSMAISQQNPNTLYAGTGGDRDGSGVFRTADGGMSWTRTTAQNPNWKRVYRIAVDSNNDQTILVGTDTGLFYSSNSGGAFAPVVSTPPINGRCETVVIDPNNSNRAVAVIFTGLYRAYYLNKNTETGVWEASQSNLVSINTDGRIEFAYAKSTSSPSTPGTPTHVYALTQGGGGTQIFKKSVDGGQTYASITTSYNPNTPPEFRLTPSTHNNTIWVSPINPNFIIAGDVNLYRSEDGGVTAERIADAYIFEHQMHVDQHCIVPAPGFNGTTNQKVYVCNDGGVYSTENIAGVSPTFGWDRKTAGYVTSQFYGAVGHFNPASSEGILVGGLQDNGSTKSSTTNPEASAYIGGDGGFAAIEANDPYWFYGEYQYGNLHRRSTWILSSPAGANFIAPFVLDPNDGNRLYMGAGSLLRTDNVKAATPTFAEVLSAGTGQSISAIAVAEGNSNIVWAATGTFIDTRLYKSTNALASRPTWDRVDDNGSHPVPNRFITRILIDPGDANLVYVTLGGFNKPDNVLKTTDGGSSWQSITGVGLTGAPVRGIARHPYDSDRLFVGTEVGLFETRDGGQEWLQADEGPTDISVDEVTFLHGSTTLLAATYGRGLWTAEIEPTTPPNRTLFDFDSDARADISVYRPFDSKWYLNRSNSGFLAQQFGVASDIPVAEDYDGDRRADITVFRDGVWHRLDSSTGVYHSVSYGVANDIPMPADFDADGRADEAVFRPSNGQWHLNRSTEGSISYQWGISTDKPVTGDFDADGRADFGVFRFVNGMWYLFDSASPWYFQWGLEGDIPVVADFDGDAQSDVAVWRPSNGIWYILTSTSQYEDYTILQWGMTGDIPVPADYDGDGRADAAVWRPSDGNWYLLQSTNGSYVRHFGKNGDLPIPRK